MTDTYSNFEDLSKHERENFDFRIILEVRDSEVAIVAPHGGGIEPGISELAVAIAGNNFSLYVFEGIKSSNNSVLHITSSGFDEQRCICLIESSNRVLTIHGEGNEQEIAYLGGLDTEMGERIAISLRKSGFEVRPHRNPCLQGVDPTNICNRGKSGAGVQIEIAFGLRRSMFQSMTRIGRQHTTLRFADFVAATRRALIST